MAEKRCYTVKEIQEMLQDIITSTRTASPSGTECTISRYTNTENNRVLLTVPLPSQPPVSYADLMNLIPEAIEYRKSAEVPILKREEGCLCR